MGETGLIGGGELASGGSWNGGNGGSEDVSDKDSLFGDDELYESSSPPLTLPLPPLVLPMPMPLAMPPRGPSTIIAKVVDTAAQHSVSTIPEQRQEEEEEEAHEQQQWQQANWEDEEWGVHASLGAQQQGQQLLRQAELDELERELELALQAQMPHDHGSVSVYSADIAGASSGATPPSPSSLSLLLLSPSPASASPSFFFQDDCLYDDQGDHGDEVVRLSAPAAGADAGGSGSGSGIGSGSGNPSAAAVDERLGRLLFPELQPIDTLSFDVAGRGSASRVLNQTDATSRPDTGLRDGDGGGSSIVGFGFPPEVSMVQRPQASPALQGRLQRQSLPHHLELRPRCPRDPPPPHIHTHDTSVEVLLPHVQLKAHLTLRNIYEKLELSEAAGKCVLAECRRYLSSASVLAAAACNAQPSSSKDQVSLRVFKVSLLSCALDLLDRQGSGARWFGQQQPQQPHLRNTTSSRSRLVWPVDSTKTMRNDRARTRYHRRLKDGKTANATTKSVAVSMIQSTKTTTAPKPRTRTTRPSENTADLAPQMPFLATPRAVNPMLAYNSPMCWREERLARLATAAEAEATGKGKRLVQ